MENELDKNFAWGSMLALIFAVTFILATGQCGLREQENKIKLCEQASKIEGVSQEMKGFVVQRACRFGNSE